jgi:hypothetical protein
MAVERDLVRLKDGVALAADSFEHFDPCIGTDRGGYRCPWNRLGLTGDCRELIAPGSG